MNEILNEWQLSPSNQVCLTTDSGANIVKAASDLNWSWISCFGHNLHLAITYAMKDEPRISRAYWNLQAHCGGIQSELETT